MYLAAILLNGLIWGTQILLVAVALYAVSQSSRIIHLATGAIGAAAVYALYAALAGGFSLLVAVVFAGSIAVLLGVLSAWVLEPYARRQEPLFGMIASFGLGMCIESLIAMIFGTDGKSLVDGILPVLGTGYFQIDLPGAITIVSGVIFAVLFWAVIRFTNLGRLLRAVAENPSLAISLGMHTSRVRIIAYCASALVAAFVLTLVGWHTALTPLMGFQLVVLAFIALLVGGMHDLRGTFVASYLLMIVPSLVIGYSPGLSENWRLVLVFIIAACILGFRPNGILARAERTA